MQHVSIDINCIDLQKTGKTAVSRRSKNYIGSGCILRAGSGLGVYNFNRKKNFGEKKRNMSNPRPIQMVLVLRLLEGTQCSENRTTFGPNYKRRVRHTSKPGLSLAAMDIKIGGGGWWISPRLQSSCRRLAPKKKEKTPMSNRREKTKLKSVGFTSSLIASEQSFACGRSCLDFPTSPVGVSEADTLDTFAKKRCR